MNITSLSHAEKILHSYIENGKSTAGDDQSLDRLWPMLAAVGNPQDELNVIHVAGTSGKTSTCYYIAALLLSSGKMVGLTVSPHVDSITERIQINGQNISNDDFCNDLGEFLGILHAHNSLTKPSYFEVLIVFILWEFHRRGVNYVVLETGLGGLLDGTNVARLQNKVCAITDIGYDHMKILGNTLQEIADQKAGIIHEKNIVFMHRQSNEIMTAVEKRVADKQALLVVSKDDTFTDAGFQQRNWSLALNVATYIASRDGLVLRKLAKSSVLVPARMEIVFENDKDSLVLDGAHNDQKMAAFVASYSVQYPNKKATVLVSFKNGKEYEGALKSLSAITDKLIITRFTAYQDVPFTAADTSMIKTSAESIGIKTSIIENYKEAFHQLMKAKGLKIVTGSFYLIGQVRTLSDYTTLLSAK